MNASADADSGSGNPDAAPTASDDPLSRSSDDAPPSGRVTLYLETDDAAPPAVGWLEPLLDRAMRLADAAEPDAALAVMLVDDTRMAQLHEQYAGVPGTTDVLTFDNRDIPDAPVNGDLVLCVDEARRQADTHGHDTRTELLLYAVHGLLHLLGEDDHTPDAYRRMHEREDALLKQLGLGPVFCKEMATPPQEATS